MKAIDSLIAQLRAEMASEIEAAYARGFIAGADEMRARILSLAQEPRASVGEDAPAETQPNKTPSGFSILPRPVRRPIDRAPRGAVTLMLDRALTEHPGLTIVEIEAIAGQYDDTVALKSVGNTLRRYEGDKYRRDKRSRWFLIDGDVGEKETAAGGDPAAGNVSG